MRFNSQVVCEFKHDTSKDNRLFATLSLSSTVLASKMILKLFSKPYQLFYYGIIINSMRLACVRATYRIVPNFRSAKYS